MERNKTRDQHLETGTKIRDLILLAEHAEIYVRRTIDSSLKCISRLAFFFDSILNSIKVINANF